MYGERRLYISNDFKVYRVPNPKDGIYKPVQALAGQEVLKLVLFYKLKDRKPLELIMVEFDRFTLDSEGGYSVPERSRSRELYNFLAFAGSTPEELAKRDEPPKIPLASIIPSIKEKESLYIYLKSKYPALSVDAPFVVENRIDSLKQTHQEYIDLVRQAKKLKRSNSQS